MESPMSQYTRLGLFKPHLARAVETPTELVLSHSPLHQLLEFTRHSIDDLVNDEIVKREVLGYYKLKCDIQRRCEATDLDRWWNGA